MTDLFGFARQQKPFRDIMSTNASIAKRKAELLFELGGVDESCA